jgi:MFS family permease
MAAHDMRIPGPGGDSDAGKKALPRILAAPPAIPRRYAWLVFGLTIGLLLSDYMSRQVINAVFPLLKSEWGLADEQLGMLGGIVPLMVGIFTVPLSYLADRFGRVRSIVLMATLWCLATLASAMAESFGEMMLARLAIGLGEAAYGSVGLAVIFSAFPARMHSTLSGLYGGAAFVGSVLGLALGGKLAAVLGWRGAFDVIAYAGFVLVGLFMLFVRERRLGLLSEAPPSSLASLSRRDKIEALFKIPTILFTYLGSATQLFITGSILIWMPSYIGRYYQLPTEQAATTAAVFILLTGLGMGLLGNVADRLGRQHPRRKLLACVIYTIASFALLMLAFRLPAGTWQLVTLGIGVFVVSGTWGPTTAVVASLVPSAIHATALAMITLLNNVLGLAPGPYVTGLLSDRYGLDFALQWIPLASIVSALALCAAYRHHDADLKRTRTLAHAARRSDDEVREGCEQGRLEASGRRGAAMTKPAAR